MLAPILPELGGGYELRYTTGLRSRDTLPDLPNLRPLGRLRKEELLEEYQQAHCLLFPTRFEGFGYPVAEALSCGLPVVTSDCSCLPELVDDSVTGFLCSRDDVEALASAIRRLANEPEIHRRMSQRAREVSVERFQLRTMAEQYFDLLTSIL